MANQKELVFTLKFRTENDEILERQATTLKDIKKSVADLEDELQNTDLGSEQWKELNANLEDSKDALKQAEEASMSLGDKLSAIPGPIGQVVQGVKGLGTAFKALIANPLLAALTAIVAVLGALYKAFASTKEGGEQLRQVSAALGAVMDVFRDVLVKVAKVLIDIFTNPVESLKNFGKLLQENLINRFTGMLELLPALGKAVGLLFQGEFAEAGKVAGDAVAKVVLGVEDFTDKIGEAGKAVKGYFDEAVAEGKKAAAIEKELQKIADAQRALNLERAKQNKIIAEAKNVFTDETKSLDEREAALRNAAELEAGLVEKEIALQARRVKAIKERNALSDSSAEALDEESQAEIRLQQLQQESVMKRTELQAQIKTLNQQRIAEAKATADAITKLENDFYLSEEQNALEAALRAEELRAQTQIEEINALKTTDEKKAELIKAAEEKSNQEVAKIRADYRQKERDAELKAIQDKYTILAFDAEANQELLKENLIAQTEILLQNETLTADQRIIIQQNLQKALAAIDEEGVKKTQEAEEKKRQSRYETLMAYSNALSAIGEIFGAESEIGKQAAAAQALLNSFLAFTQVLADPTIPSILKPIIGAGILIKGIKQQQAIMSTNTQVNTPTVAIPKFQTGGIVGGYGDTDSQMAMLQPGESVINARSTQLFAPLLSDINQFGGGASFSRIGQGISTSKSAELSMMNQMANQSQQPIKTYVVSTEMSSQQQLDTVIKNRSTL